MKDKQDQPQSAIPEAAGAQYLSAEVIEAERISKTLGDDYVTRAGIWAQAARDLDLSLWAARRQLAQREAVIAQGQQALADANQQLDVLRPGGVYAWKHKYEQAEALLTQRTQELEQEIEEREVWKRVAERVERQLEQRTQERDEAREELRRIQRFPGTAIGSAEKD